MSKFKTSIKVVVEDVKAVLPKGCYLERIEFNAKTNTVEVLWEHDAWKTPFTFPVEMSVETLRDKVADAVVPQPEKTGQNVQTSPQETIDIQKRRSAKRSL
jgi:hypothetical protein